ncbi:hypothetical protein HMPREF9450_01401 [Alistipes indistinctus YIT 12060]|uniref:Uncharacterized protein n=2 Tax=Alistipes indistinctus TaxID=626932 RepID=G5H9T6_9BACT|nr:hypothetical protein HMPREF9450_01401 [Alistipes indistinctus YIT 12060]
MQDAGAELVDIIKSEKNFIDKKIAVNNTPFLFIDLIKAIDYYWLCPYENKDNFEGFIQYGFPVFLKQFYLTSNFKADSLPIHHSSSDSLSFCHYYLWMYGKCKLLERYVRLASQKEVSIARNTPTEFTIEADSCHLEYVENRSLDEYFKVIRESVLKNKIADLDKINNLILKSLDSRVEAWKKDYIRYDSSPDIDDYYYQTGYVALATSQLYDDFNDDFTFGNITYKHILDVIQSVMGVALKHIDACMLLLDKSPQTKIYNILSIPFLPEELYSSYSNYLGIDKDEVKQIFDLLIVSPENIDDHLSSEKDFSPPFIKIGNKFIYRSIKGCLRSPVLFVQNELKRKYPKDYFRWINEREKIFRDQLYNLFSSDRFIKVNRNIEINSNGIRTDIDAAIFDTQTKSLSIFQLKWQDKFASDMQARKSRIANFYPKAKEWIDKIDSWKSENTSKNILSALNIKGNDISVIYLFVIGRYNTHFSNQEIDKRAAWGSWYHVVELMHKIRTNFDNPVQELHFKLQLDSPMNKKLDVTTEKLEFSNYLITWNYK